MRALPKERPATLTAPPDGQSLETIIGELQSVWGVPQYPQEFRITIKVAEERDQRPDSSGEEAGRAEPSRGNGDGPRREKAPSAPLMRMGAQERDGGGEGQSKRRRRGRRRRRGGGDQGSGGSSGGGPTPG